MAANDISLAYAGKYMGSLVLCSAEGIVLLLTYLN